MMNTAATVPAVGSKTLVVGLGLTGWSVVRHLAARGEAVTVTDSRAEPPYLDALRKSYPATDFVPDLPTAAFDEFDQVVASPGIRAHAEHVIGDIELFVRQAEAPVVAITGSNGKSTVTSLVGEMLNATGPRALVGGNIGTPALDLLEQPVPEIYVLELSSFQLDTTSSLRASAAVVLNISEDHMDRYPDLARYRDAKVRVYEGCSGPVVNRDDPLLASNVSRSNAISFGLDTPRGEHFGVSESGEWFCFGTRKLARVVDMTLQGRQNAANMLAAFALVRAAGYALEQPMIDAALAYRGLPHRCELVGRWNDVSWINDSKGTNVGATLAAIQGVDAPLVLIAGGQGKGADFSALGAVLDDNTRGVVLIGEDADQIAAALSERVAVQRAVSLQAAIEATAALAESGDTVLFSPACASFDMFKSFEDRGDQFRALVQAHFERGGAA